MDRVIELSGCAAQAGQEATILLQVSVPLHTHTQQHSHHVPDAQRTAGPFWRCAHFLGHLYPLS